MSVTIHWEVDRPAELDDATLARAASAALAHGGRSGVPLSVVFVDDATLARLHAEHLGDPSPTDVMSFDLGGDEALWAETGDAPPPVGEVVVSVDRAREVAARRGVSLARETTLYVVHGVLHLCGHDDHAPAERERMRAAERAVMEALGFADDDLPHEVD